MPSEQNKTIPTTQDVLDFLANLEDEQQQKDSQILITIMQRISGKPPVMWGPSIIGFGIYHYKYESGREGDMPEIAFSPRKGKLTLYVTYNAEKYADIRARLGKHKTSKACIYINKLSDVDINVLEDLIHMAHNDTARVF